MDVDAVEASLTETTTGGSGHSTLRTSRRVFAPHSLEQGVGVVNSKRAVSESETTILPSGDTLTAAAGAAGALAFALTRD